MIGEGAEGPFAVDIVRDGPHGLVAGTTGAGKSELLQTIIGSLAVGNRPDEMTFVLVDYKGGAAFKDCNHLPHTVGMVTDLDGHLTERALQSLNAELKRREGKAIVATGSVRLAQTLVRTGLVDEYRLFVYPVVAGRGRRLFETADMSALGLTEARPFRSGVVLLRYRTGGSD